MTEVAPGTVVAGRYTVGDRLGSGGMADVYLAHDAELGRNVALKVLHRRFADDSGFRDRFRLEARAAAGLQHPNVVSVFDRGDWEGTSWIAMEYLPGHTLKEVIREHAPLEPAAATRIAIQICRAVQFAHAAGVVHRDIKPQNVMIGPEGRATVTDFGIARAGAAGITEAGSILGTAHYVSPEQAQGLDAGPGSDIYSIGIVIYEMLTGRVPFDAESPVAIAMQQVNADPAPPSATVPGIPADLEALTLECLGKDPAARPASAGELADRLDAISERLRTSADPGTTVALGSAVAPAVPATAVAAAAGLAAGASAAELRAGSEGADVAGRESPAAGEGSGAKGGGNRRKWLIGGGIAAAVALAVAAFLVLPGGSERKAAMPLVVGRDLALATTLIQNRGFTGSPEVTWIQSTRPKGMVMQQNPLANANVPIDTKIRLTVSNGPGNAQIPTVADMPEADARKQLEKLGFKVVERNKASSDVDSGHAIGTDPPAGTSVAKGSEVALFISTGPAPVLVPDVTQDQITSARTTLQSAGFVVSTTSDSSCSGPDQTVISQNPQGGSKAPKGTTIKLVVADGTNCATVPNVYGKTQSDAQAAFDAAGFTNVSLPPPSTPGWVVRTQSVPAGRSKPKSTSITVTYGP